MESRIRQLEALLKEAVVVDTDVGEARRRSPPAWWCRCAMPATTRSSEYLVGSVEERREGVSVGLP